MSRSEGSGPPCVGVIYLVSDAVQKLITPKQHSHPQWPKNIHHAHLQPSGANTCSRSRSFINRASSSHLLCILRESKRLFGEHSKPSTKTGTIFISLVSYTIHLM